MWQGGDEAISLNQVGHILAEWLGDIARQRDFFGLEKVREVKRKNKNKRKNYECDQILFNRIPTNYSTIIIYYYYQLAGLRVNVSIFVLRNRKLYYYLGQTILYLWCNSQKMFHTFCSVFSFRFFIIIIIVCLYISFVTKIVHRNAAFCADC